MNREKIETAANEITSSFEEANFFIKGAEWAERETISKSCEVIADILEPYEFDRTDEIKRIVESFKKNMIEK